jgi:hypothetical protein
MRFPKSRLITAAAVAGTACALAAAGTASAGTSWSKAATIPASYTNATPGLAQFYQNNVPGTFFIWKGQRSNDVYYRYKINGKWSPVRAVPGAHTNSSPAAAFYTNAQSQPSEFIAWKALHSTTIWYATGLIRSGKNSALNWTKSHSIAVKGDKLAFSDTGPSVLFPANSPNGRVIVAWRGPGHHVRYELGSESGKYDRLFNFDKSNWIGTNTTLDKTTTSGAPSLAEQIGPGNNGIVYVFWKADGNGKTISVSRTPDYAGTGLAANKYGQLTWTPPVFVPGADSTSGPSASDLSAHGNGGLMVVYKGPSGDFIRYQILPEPTTATPTPSWTSYAFVTGKDNTTAIGPAVLNGLVANVSPTASGLMYLHNYTG